MRTNTDSGKTLVHITLKKSRTDASNTIFSNFFQNQICCFSSFMLLFFLQLYFYYYYFVNNTRWILIAHRLDGTTVGDTLDSTHKTKCVGTVAVQS